MLWCGVVWCVVIFGVAMVSSESNVCELSLKEENVSIWLHVWSEVSS